MDVREGDAPLLEDRAVGEDPGDPTPSPGAVPDVAVEARSSVELLELPAEAVLELEEERAYVDAGVIAHAAIISTVAARLLSATGDVPSAGGHPAGYRAQK